MKSQSKLVKGIQSSIFKLCNLHNNRKVFEVCTLIVIFGFLSFFAGCKKKETTPKSLVKVGDSYQGGIIAYLFHEGEKGFVSGESHGIIAAKKDQDTSIEWGCYSTLIGGADNIGIGTGSENTAAIMNGCVTLSTAARICGDLVLNGYDDWCLPSKDELDKLYGASDMIGHFNQTGSYWSSSQYDDKGAWKLVFPDGKLMYYGKASPNFVRAIRYF